MQWAQFVLLHPRTHPAIRSAAARWERCPPNGHRSQPSENMRWRRSSQSQPAARREKLESHNDNQHCKRDVQVGQMRLMEVLKSEQQTPDKTLATPLQAEYPMHFATGHLDADARQEAYEH